MNSIALKRLFVLVSIFSLVFLIGCAGMEFAPKKGIWYYPKELPDAEKAVNNAQQSGKDKQCPAEFAEAKNLKDNAYETYWSCRTKEAIEMAKDASKKANALCPAKPKPAAAAEKVLDRFTLTINFDFNKSDIRKADMAQLKKAIDFVKKYPGAKIKLEGHTDSIGSDQYNQALSERRADATMKYLIDKGNITASRMSTVGYGESRPVDTNKTAAGRAKNRRVEILILAD
jgi:outer membrane protein OmpA-like peptidoglycan-associated protein